MKDWQVTRARLIEAVFSHRSSINGDLIYQCLETLEALATKEQDAELERYRNLVQTWSETWYPRTKQ